MGREEIKGLLMGVGIGVSLGYMLKATSEQSGGRVLSTQEDQNVRHPEHTTESPSSDRSTPARFAPDD